MNVTLTSAQLLDLHNNPALLVPGVPGKILVPLGGVMLYHAGTTPYAGGNDLIVLYEGLAATTGRNAFLIGATIGFMQQSTDRWCQLMQHIFYSDNGFPADTAIGKGLALGIEETPLTDGDGTLDVSIFYYIVPPA